MKYLKKNFNISNLVLFFILVLFTCSISLIGFNNESIISIARISTYSLAVFLIILFLSTTTTSIKIDNRILFFFFLIFWVGLRAENLYGLGLLFQTFLLFSSMLILKNINIENHFHKAMLCGGLLYLTLCFINFYYFQVFYNTNYIGLCGLIFFIYFLSLRSKYGICLAIFSLIFIIISGTRSALLGIIFAYVIYKILNQNSVNRWLLIFLFISLLLVFFNSSYYSYLISDDFAQFVFDKTGKRLESGRFDIWYEIFSKMNFFDYIFGLGGGLSYEEIIGAKLSAHSGYVYILSSYGIFGLFLFMSCVTYSLIKLYKNSYFFSFILFVALLFREFFEVTLLHNSFPVALLFWAFLSNGYLDKK